MLSQAEKAVVAVIAYSAQFDHPLTLSEIFERLLSAEGLSTVDEKFASAKLGWKATPLALKEQLALILRSLVRKKIVIQQRTFFTLSGKDIAFQKRRLSAVSRREKKDLILELVKVVERVPWILGLAITGSYAAGGALEKDDIDFLAITQKNRLWLARLTLLFYSWRLGRRPQLPNGDISHSWDLNFWLDETRLTLPERQTTVYEAYELLQTKWIYSRADIRKRLFRVNPWVSKYLVTWPKFTVNKFTTQSKSLDVMSIFNMAAFALEVGYRNLRHGRQRADLHSAFFHPAHTKQQIFLAWKSLYQRAIGKKVVLVTGVFDLLHEQHKRFLQAAKKAGDFLIVGLESDARVRALKGAGRPVNTQAVRQQNLRQLLLADEVFILPENFDQKLAREQLIAQLQPHVLAVSSHTPHLDSKRRTLAKHGGKVKVVYKYRPGFSSTRLIEEQKLDDTLGVSGGMRK